MFTDMDTNFKFKGSGRTRIPILVYDRTCVSSTEVIISKGRYLDLKLRLYPAGH
jgi:hypothetical protein